MNPLLTVSGLSYRKQKSGLLGNKELFRLSPLSFELKRGETMAIMGENGSGKSLLAKLLVGVVKPEAGSILLNGDPVCDSGSRRRFSAIRMIFQHSKESLNPGLTLGRQLEEALILNTGMSSTERKRQIENTLVQVGMLPEHQYFYRHMLGRPTSARSRCAGTDTQSTGNSSR